MGLWRWLTAEDVEEREEWAAFGKAVADRLASDDVVDAVPAPIAWRVGRAAPPPKRKRPWSWRRRVKSVERWLALLGPFAALAAAMIGLAK
jgi:hypothetical protein